MNHQLLLYAGYAVVLSIGVYFVLSWLGKEPESEICHDDIVSNNGLCRPVCRHGYFSLSGMDSCRPWLGCRDMGDITLGEIIGQGVVKRVRRGEWQHYIIAVNTLRTTILEEDFLHGLEMIRKFQPSAHVIQLIGTCGTTYFTEFYPLGSADGLSSLLQTEAFQKYSNIKNRFKTCLSYIKAINFLHTSSAGVRVMCDSNDPNKTLSQFLIQSDLELILNDLDALPEVKDGETIKCGHKELFGDYVAPEQLWPYEDEEFNDHRMPGYDERTDIWKIPDVCNMLIGGGSTALKLHLFEINARCKQYDPRSRPTIGEVLEVYNRTLNMLDKKGDG